MRPRQKAGQKATSRKPDVFGPRDDVQMIGGARWGSNPRPPEPQSPFAGFPGIFGMTPRAFIKQQQQEAMSAAAQRAAPATMLFTEAAIASRVR